MRVGRGSWSVPVGGALREGAVEVGQGLRVAGHERLVGRLFGRERRARALRRPAASARAAAGLSVLVPRIEVGCDFSVCAAVADEELREGAVAVEALADARRARRGCTRTPCSSPRRRSRSRPAAWCCPAGMSTFVRHLLNRSLCLNSGVCSFSSTASDGRRGLQALGDAAELARRERGLHLFDPRQRGGDGARRRAHARQDVLGERPRRPERGVQLREAAVDRS